MKFKNLLTETYECIKIGGILRNLSNDEMKIYKRIKEEGRVFKKELTEYEANVATTMVSKGLLRRKKAQQDEGMGRIYYIARGRKGHLVNKPIDEVAPPGKESEKWIKKNKKRFKDKYGKDYERYLYGKAWNNYNGKKKLKESIDPFDTNFDVLQNDIEEIIKEYKSVKDMLFNSNNISDNNFAGFFEDIIKFCYHYNNIDVIKGLENQVLSAKDSLMENVEEHAMNSGDFNVYDDDEYDREATHENIMNDALFGEILAYHMPKQCAKEVFEKIADGVNERIKQYKDSSEEPEFDGDFDEITAVKQEPKEDNDSHEDDDRRILEQILQIAETILVQLRDAEHSPRRATDREVEQAFNKIDDMKSDLYKYDLDDTFMEIRDIIFDYVDDNFAGDTDYGFMAMIDGEYNSDASWDRMHEESDYDLIRNYGYESEYKTFIEDIADAMDGLIQDYKSALSTKNNIPAAVDDGSEYDE